jgi:hypothetical protein
MPPKPPICTVLKAHGFWLEIADDHSAADLYDLGRLDGSDGRPTPFPVKRLPGIVPTDESKPTYGATFVAAQAWARWAREQQSAGVDPFDGDGYRPLGSPPAVDALALTFDPDFWSDAPAAAVEPLTTPTKRRPRKD